MKKLVLVLTIALGLMLLLPAIASADLVSHSTDVSVGGFVDWYGEGDHFNLTYDGENVMIDYAYAGHAPTSDWEPFTGHVTFGGGGSIDAVVPLGDETEPDATVHLTLTPYGRVTSAGHPNKWWAFTEDGDVLHYMQAVEWRSVTVDGYIDIPGVLHLTGEQFSSVMWNAQNLRITSTTAALPPASPWSRGQSDAPGLIP